jgi:hypothetical protein
MCFGEIDVSSDRRVKQNIHDLSIEDSLRFVRESCAKHFNYISEPGQKSYGWIAQDVIKAGFWDLVNVAPNAELEEEIDDDGFINPSGKQFSIITGHVVPMLQMALKHTLESIDCLEDSLHDQRLTIEEHDSHIDDLTACLEQALETIQDLSAENLTLRDRLTIIESIIHDITLGRHNRFEVL